MIFTTFKRITRTGFVNFWRNGFLSFAAVVVITLSLLAFGGLIFASAFGRALLTEVKEKVDINIYFTLDAPENDILALQKDIRALPEVASTAYISRDQALEEFQTKWKNNALIIQGLTEIGSNPFPAALNIKAKDPSNYGDIVSFLGSKKPAKADGMHIIEKINYEENKLIIDRLSSIIPTVEQAGAVVAIIFILVAIIIVFNTIRLIIYTARDEISVMKLVGASNTYVRGPFFVSGVIYGLVSGLIAVGLLAVFAYWGDVLILKLAGVDVASNFELMVNVLSVYFVKNFSEIFTLIVGAGIVLGGISSYIAARRYLRI
jgi:cell division transport system permease protein